MVFTFYADLVGISALYAASPTHAYNKLNEFYNAVFYGLSAYYNGIPDRKVEMYSDSLIVSGDDPQLFLSTIAPVYMTLLSKGLLLRGGMVQGALSFDVRITTENFQKNLPNSDVLARCVALERKNKGARLLISAEVVEPFFECCRDWLTLPGYAINKRHGDEALLLQRSIVPTHDGYDYELLYPTLAHSEYVDIEKRIEELNYLIKQLPQDISKHYTDTRGLLMHSKERLADMRGI